MTRKAKQTVKEVVTMKLSISTGQSHIDDGECGLPYKCMERLACTQALISVLTNDLGRDPTPEEVRRLHVKVDGAFISFNYNGYRWKAPTPAVARNALIYFDQGRRWMIKPHRYKITAERKSKIVQFDDDRREQINRARQRRAAEGRPDNVTTKPSIHHRVVGLSPGYGFIKRRLRSPFKELN
jgi:hypothetical protein